MTKTCKTCGIEKDISEFSKGLRGLYGVRAHCKICCNLYKKQWGEENRDRVICYSRNWYQSNTDKALEAVKNWRDSNPGVRDEINKRYADRNPEKIKSHRIVHQAVRDGLLVKSRCPCGSINVQGHHEDYSKPLEVVWLCPRCHTRLHIDRGDR